MLPAPETVRLSDLGAIHQHRSYWVAFDVARARTELIVFFDGNPRHTAARPWKTVASNLALSYSAIDQRTDSKLKSKVRIL